jgi:hypothetical protein
LEGDASGKHTESEVAVGGLNKKAVPELRMLSEPLPTVIEVNWGGRTVSPQRIKIPKNTIGPLSLVLSAIKPHKRLPMIRHQAPIDTMAFDLSRSNPKETTSDGA